MLHRHEQYIKDESSPAISYHHSYQQISSPVVLQIFFPAFSMSFSKNLLIALAAAPILTNAAVLHRRGAKPGLSFDPNTTKDCTWWTDYDGSVDCPTMLTNEFATLEDFRRWVSRIELAISRSSLTVFRILPLERTALG